MRENTLFFSLNFLTFSDKAPIEKLLNMFYQAWESLALSMFDFIFHLYW